MTQSQSPYSKMSFSRIVKLAIATTIALAAWAYASPPGSDPDGDYHIVSIYCGGGFKQGVCEQATTHQGKEINGVVKVRSSLLIRNGQVPEIYSDQKFVYTNRHNVSGTYSNYPKGFYWIQSKFTTENVGQTVLLLRLINVLLFVAPFIFANCMLPRSLRKSFNLSSLVMLLPLGIFTIASNNPSSWAISGGAIYWVFLYAYFTAKSPMTNFWFGALSFFSAAVGSLSRGDAALWTFVITLFVALIVFSRRLVSLRELSKKSLWAIAFLVPAFFSVFSSNQFRSVTEGFTDPKGIWGRDPNNVPGFEMSHLLYNLTKLPGVFAGIFGLQGTGGGLGWGDIFMPEIVSLGMFFLVVYLITNAYKKRSKLEYAAIAVVLSALFIASLLVAQRTGILFPQGIQSRYLIPVLVPLVGVYFVGSPLILRIERSRFAKLLLANSLIVIYVCALHATMMRYVHGPENFFLDMNWNLNSDRFWWWDGFIQPMSVLFLGSIAFSKLVIYVLFDNEVDAPGSFMIRVRRRGSYWIDFYKKRPKLVSLIGGNDFDR